MTGENPAATSNTERWRSQAFRTPKVLAATLLLIVCLAAIDAFLVRADHNERVATAAAAFDRAEQAARAGNQEEALEFYRAARNIRRDDERYQLALAQALRRAGRMQEAEREARRLLLDHPTHGPANLALARILSEQNKFDDSEWFYHRAIYGNWSENDQQQRRAVRFELADLLAKRGRQEALVAEVLVLMGEQDEDPRTTRRAADLLLTAGAGRRAAELYRQLLRERPRDAELYGLHGTALLQNGQYRLARANLETAMALGSADPAIQERAALARNVVTMDPYARGLGSRERARRARLLLEKSAALLAGCAEQSTPAVLTRARQQLEAKQPRVTDESIEDDLAMTEQLWDALPLACRRGVEAASIGAIVERFER